MFRFTSFSPESVIDEAVENDETEQWQKSIQHHVHVDHVDLRLTYAYGDLPNKMLSKAFYSNCSTATVPTNTLIKTL